MNFQVMKRIEMADASVKGSVPVSVKSLEHADFCGCIADGKPCPWANTIRYNGPDPSSIMLGCLYHKKYMSIEDALSCPKGFSNQE